MRKIVYANDIAMMSGKSMQSAQRLMREMRKYYGKKARQFITIREFCHYTGIHPEEVKEYFEAIKEPGVAKG